MNEQKLIETIISHAESLWFSDVQDYNRSVILGGHKNSRCKIIFHEPEFTKVLMIYLRSPKNYREIIINHDNGETTFDRFEQLIALAKMLVQRPLPSKREISQKVFLTDTFIMEQINNMAQEL